VTGIWVVNKVLHRYQEYLKEIVASCGQDPRLADLPLKVRAHVKEFNKKKLNILSIYSSMQFMETWNLKLGFNLLNQPSSYRT
jgi:hypothetical protein